MVDYSVITLPSNTVTVASNAVTLACNHSLVGAGLRFCFFMETFLTEAFLGFSSDSFLFLETVCFLWTWMGSSSIGLAMYKGSEQSPPGHIDLVKRWLLAISCYM